MTRKNIDRCFFCGKGERYVPKLVAGLEAAICDSCILQAAKIRYGAFDSESFYNLPAYSNGYYEYLKENHDQIKVIHEAVSEMLSMKKYDLGFLFMQNLELSRSIAYYNEAIKLNPENKQIKEFRNKLKSFIGELSEIFGMPDDFKIGSEFEKNFIREKLTSINKKINQYPEEKKSQLFQWFALISLQDCINKEKNTFELTDTYFKKVVEQLNMFKKKK